MLRFLFRVLRIPANPFLFCFLWLFSPPRGRCADVMVCDGAGPVVEQDRPGCGGSRGAADQESRGRRQRAASEVVGGLRTQGEEFHLRRLAGVSGGSTEARSCAGRPCLLGEARRTESWFFTLPGRVRSTVNAIVLEKVLKISLGSI